MSSTSMLRRNKTGGSALRADNFFLALLVGFFIAAMGNAPESFRELLSFLQEAINPITHEFKPPAIERVDARATLARMLQELGSFQRLQVPCRSRPCLLEHRGNPTSRHRTALEKHRHQNSPPHRMRERGEYGLVGVLRLFWSRLDHHCNLAIMLNNGKRKSGASYAAAAKCSVWYLRAQLKAIGAAPNRHRCKKPVAVPGRPWLGDGRSILAVKSEYRLSI